MHSSNVLPQDIKDVKMGFMPSRLQKSHCFQVIEIFFGVIKMDERKFIREGSDIAFPAGNRCTCPGFPRMTFWIESVTT